MSPKLTLKLQFKALKKLHRKKAQLILCKNFFPQTCLINITLFSITMQNSTGNPHPICRIFNNELKIWQPFHTFSLTIQGQQLIFHYQNTQAIANNHIQKSITHDYIAYFSRIIPSAVYSPVKDSKKSIPSPSKIKNELRPEEINCMLVLEDLTLRYSPILHEDQYIILGFQVANPTYSETNRELNPSDV